MKLYRNMAARLVGSLFLAGAFVLVSAAPSEAVLMVWGCDDAACLGGVNFTVTDNGAGDASNNVATQTGLITINVAGFTGSVTASSKPLVGDPTQPFLNLTYNLGPAAFNPAVGGFATPFLFVSESGFTAFPGTATLNANASSGGGGVNVYSGGGVFAPPGGATIITCAMPCNNLQAGVTGPSPYYLAMRVAPTLSTGASPAASGDATLRVVPDGGSTAALLGSVLVGFGILRRRFNV